MGVHCTAWQVPPGSHSQVPKSLRASYDRFSKVTLRSGITLGCVQAGVCQYAWLYVPRCHKVLACL